MKASMLLFPLLLLPGLLSGQAQTTYTENDLRELANFGSGLSGVRTIDLAYKGVRGTTLLSDDWQQGAFRLKGQELFSQDLSVHIDLVKQLMHFRLNNGFVGSIPGFKLDAIRLNTGPDQFRVFKVYPESEVEGSNVKKMKFYEELYAAGTFTLLQQHYKFFREADYKRAYGADRPYDEYVDQSNLWLRENGQAYHKVKLKKKAILKVLPNHADQIKSVIKSEEIILQREEDLIHLLQTLQSRR